MPGDDATECVAENSYIYSFIQNTSGQVATAYIRTESS